MVRYASYPSLEDRVVFVTGGGSGIGASVVEHLCAQRARVAFVDIQREASDALVARVAARGLPAPAFIPCDLRDIAALREFALQIHGAQRTLFARIAIDADEPPRVLPPSDPVFLKHRFRRALGVE